MPPRALAAAAYLQAFVLSGVAVVLLTRAILRATGYPQLGGGLHIAHVLWGGLLLAAGLGVALVFLGGAARMTGAILGVPGRLTPGATGRAARSGSPTGGTGLRTIP